MHGATVAAVVAVVAWLGLWAYLRVMRSRLEAALAELDAADSEVSAPAPAVIVDAPAAGGDDE